MSNNNMIELAIQSARIEVLEKETALLIDILTNADPTRIAAIKERRKAHDMEWANCVDLNDGGCL